MPLDDAASMAAPLGARVELAGLAAWWRGLFMARDQAIPDDLAPLVPVEQANDFAGFALWIACPGFLTSWFLLADFRGGSDGLARLALTVGLTIIYPLLYMRARAWRLNPQKSTNAARDYLNQSTLSLAVNGIGWGMLICLCNAHPSILQRNELYGVIVGAVALALLISPLQCALAYLLPVSAGALLAVLLQPKVDGFAPVMLVSFVAYALFTCLHHNRRLNARTIGSLQAQEHVEVIKLLLRDFEESASDWLWETDADLRLHNISNRLAQISCREPAELDGVFPYSLRGGAVAFEIAPGTPAGELARAMEAREPFSDMVIPVTVHGDERFWSLTGKPNYDRAGRFTGYHGVGSDITAERRQQAQIAHLARHDTLTGLPNRMSFSEFLEKFCATCATQPFALVYLDLDFFKTVNDTLGHAAGDAVLLGAAKRMRAALPKGAIAARLGGDEFAILLPGSDPAEINAIIERTAASVSEPYEFEGQEAKIGASIGIAFAPLHGTVPAALLVHGDLAMYRAKSEGKGRQCVYNPAMDERRYDRRAAGAFARGTV